jgi:pimeloyl-ACP methyl ester carboxylesterase
VVLVHGIRSTASAWDSYLPPTGFTAAGGFLREAHYDWEGYAVGDGSFPGVLKTGSPWIEQAWDDVNSIGTNAEEMAKYIRALREDRNTWQVDVIAHSMGGLISRQYIHSYMPRKQGQDQPRAVERLIMLGTPNGGSRCAWALGFAYVNYLAQLTPGYVTSKFNSQIRERNGIPFYMVASEDWFTCGVGWGDLAVTYRSATSISLDGGIQQTDSRHSRLIKRQNDFDLAHA